MKSAIAFSAVFLVLAGPVLSDQIGDEMVRHWFAKIREIRPITAETTTAYSFGKWTAKYKLTGSFTEQSHVYSTSALLTYDAGFPTDLMGDPMRDNLNPLLLSEQDLMVLPNGVGDRTKYLGKETIDGTEYDVVQLEECLYHHDSSRSLWLDSLRRKEDNTIPIKWYLDQRGELRRITYTAEINVSPAAPRNDPTSVPSGKYKFTATMVVNNYRRSRPIPTRKSLPEPLYSIDINTSSVQAFAFSPDGKLLAIATGTPQMFSTETGMPAYTVMAGDRTSLTAFSANGKYVAYSCSSGIKIFQTSDGRCIQTIANPRRGIESLRLSPDGSLIATTGPDTEIWNVATGKIERVLKDNGGTYEAIFCANGRRLVTAGYNAETVVWESATWTVVERLPIRADMFLPIAVAPDGSRVAMATEDGGVLLWDGSKSTPARKLQGAAGSLWFLSFSADGTKLYACDRDERGDPPTRTAGYVSWNVATGSLIADFAGMQLNRSSMGSYGIISPDGRLAAFRNRPPEGGTIEIIRLP